MVSNSMSDCKDWSSSNREEETDVRNNWNVEPAGDYETTWGK